MTYLQREREFSSITFSSIPSDLLTKRERESSWVSHSPPYPVTYLQRERERVLEYHILLHTSHSLVTARLRIGLGTDTLFWPITHKPRPQLSLCTSQRDNLNGGITSSFTPDRNKQGISRHFYPVRDCRAYNTDNWLSKELTRLRHEHPTRVCLERRELNPHEEDKHLCTATTDDAQMHRVVSRGIAQKEKNELHLVQQPWSLSQRT